MKSIQRKTLLYKTGVEYGDYTINHVEGCAHGCLYPCYAMMMAKRFGKVKSYQDWLEPKIVSNALDLLRLEIPKYKNKIKFVHLCFSTDPFMYQHDEISELSIKIINLLNHNNIRCTALTKGLLPISLTNLDKKNEFGITLVSLNEVFRKKYEPFSAAYKERISSLYNLHKNNVKTWVSIEPYPTPNIVKQNFDNILDSISFADKIIFGKLNYNPLVKKYSRNVEFFNELSHKVIEFCERNDKEYHIKNGTMLC
jgi:DNA repair photolyase